MTRDFITRTFIKLGQMTRQLVRRARLISKNKRRLPSLPPRPIAQDIALPNIDRRPTALQRPAFSTLTPQHPKTARVPQVGKATGKALGLL